MTSSEQDPKRKPLQRQRGSIQEESRLQGTSKGAVGTVANVSPRKAAATQLQRDRHSTHCQGQSSMRVSIWIRRGPQERGDFHMTT